jgi:hypothetical protein
VVGVKRLDDPHGRRVLLDLEMQDLAALWCDGKTHSQGGDKLGRPGARGDDDIARRDPAAIDVDRADTGRSPIEPGTTADHLRTGGDRGVEQPSAHRIALHPGRRLDVERGQVRGEVWKVPTRLFGLQPSHGTGGAGERCVCLLEQRARSRDEQLADDLEARADSHRELGIGRQRATLQLEDGALPVPPWPADDAGARIRRAALTAVVDEHHLGPGF